MLDPCDFDNWASCVLCCCAKNAIAKYVSCGFSITELDDFDVGPVSAGMFWMTIDDDVFHINFSDIAIYKYPDPMHPVVCWTFGGIHSGK